MKINFILSATMKLLSILLTTTFLIIGCKKEEEPKPQFPEESFFQEFITQSGFDKIKVPVVNWETSYELGINFSPLVSGKINAIKIALPHTSPTLKVTLWEVSTRTIINQLTVKIDQAETYSTLEIQPIPLEKSKKYILSMQTNSFFTYYRTNHIRAEYPYTVGNIVINNSHYEISPDGNPIYPAQTIDTQFYGNIDFVFQQTE